MKISRNSIAAALVAVGVASAAAIFTLTGPSSNHTMSAPLVPSNHTVAVGLVLSIDVVALQRLMTVDSNLVIVDVRKVEERTGPLGYIPQSLSIPEKTVLDHPESLPTGKTLVFICHSGPRSLKVARKAAALGLTSYYVKGGMVAWRHMKQSIGKENLPAQPSPPAPEEHPEETPFFGKDMGC